MIFTFGRHKTEVAYKPCFRLPEILRGVYPAEGGAQDDKRGRLRIHEILFYNYIFFNISCNGVS